MTKNTPAPGFVLAAALLCSCAPKPVLYPNDHYKEVGKAQADADIADCRKKADDYLASHKGDIVVKHATFGAVSGAAIGVIAGLFSGDVARAAAEGAAIGGAAGAVGGAATPDQVKQRYVETCLREKGYQMLGWK